MSKIRRLGTLTGFNTESINFQKKNNTKKINEISLKDFSDSKEVSDRKMGEDLSNNNDVLLADSAVSGIEEDNSGR